MHLALEHCVVRSWERSDVPALVRNADHHIVWRNLRDRFPYPYTRAAGEAWVRAARTEHPESSFAIEFEGEAVGGIGLLLQEDVARRSAEVGYWLGPESWGRGLATEALIGFTDWAFANLDICRLFANVFEWNPASCRVLEKAGYEFEGRLRKSVTKEGQTIDQLLYAVVRERPDGARVERRGLGR